MASQLTIYSYPGQPQAAIALAAANYNGVPLTLSPIDFKKDPSFKKKNPLVKVPVLSTPQGYITESGAILRYIVRVGHDVGLYGNNVFEMGQVDKWIDFSQVEVHANVAPWLYPVLGFAEFNADVTKAAQEKTKTILKVLDAHLESRTFLVGERITAADLAVAFRLYAPFALLFDPAFRKPFPNVTRWVSTVLGQPETTAKNLMMQVPFKLADRAMKPGELKKSAEAKKPEAKKAADAAPSKFNLDAWKRLYSNADDTRKDAMPKFWEMHDPENWTIWHAEYKYADDNESMLQVRNLIGGTFQRLSHAHKVAFGNVCIFKDPLTMAGYWLLKGKGELPEEFKISVDTENYTWRVADVEKEKELIADYWSWDGKFGGRNFSGEAKTFK